MKLVQNESPQAKKAFGLLYERNKGSVMATLRYWNAPQNQVEELMHDVFIKAYQNRMSYDSTRPLKAWVLTIAKNLVLDTHRKKKEILEKNGDEQPGGSIPDERLDAESALIEKSNQDSVFSCIQNLNSTQKEVLQLRIEGELSYDEISEETGLSLSAVKSTLHRAKLALIECLKGKDLK
tara:strand:- start:2733 stop:3272 length:540 start_codon:yes stop_codon:yes gene_type:complete